MISVILPIYKERLDWIHLSVDSILNQTYSDFELLLINDNPESQENLVLIQEYEKKDSRVRGIKHKENIGLPRSLNLALNESKGNYIARMDADDISMPQRFAKQVSFLNEHPEVGVVGTFGWEINEAGEILNQLNIYEHDRELKGLTLFYTPFIHPSVMFRKELILEHPYDENCRIGQDRELWCRLKNQTKFYNIPENLIKYRVSSFQAPQKAGKKRSKESMLYLSERIVKYWDLDMTYNNIYAEIALGQNLNLTEINNFFIYLLCKVKVRAHRYFIIKKYIECLIKLKKYRIIYNPVLRQYPSEYVNAISHSVKRYLRKLENRKG